MQISRTKIMVLILIVLVVALLVAVVIDMTVVRKKESPCQTAFDYDLEKYRKTDQALIRYRESKQIDTRFQTVFAVAVDAKDKIYVAGDTSIRVFDEGGNQDLEFNLPQPARCLSIASDGTIYVGTKDKIEIYDSSGKRKSGWKITGKKPTITSVAAYDDNVFVADAGDRVVLRYDTSGNLKNRIGDPDRDKNIPGFVIPSPYFDLAVAPDGLLRVANPGFHFVEAYTFDGYREFWWGKPSLEIDGFCGCCNPANFAILPDGRFVTAEKGIPRVKIYSSQGKFESVVAGAEEFDAREEIPIPDGRNAGKPVILDVAADSKGHIIVLDPIRKAVRIFVLSKETGVETQPEQKQGVAD